MYILFLWIVLSKQGLQYVYICYPLQIAKIYSYCINYFIIAIVSDCVCLKQTHFWLYETTMHYNVDRYSLSITYVNRAGLIDVVFHR